MPDLNFRITGAESASHGLTPLIHFQAEVTTSPEAAEIRSVLLHAQIRIQAPQRAYTPPEREKLVELFGTPDRWGQTLRSKLWAHAHVTVNSFAGKTVINLPVQCTYDMNVLASKYFYALEDGDVPLLFLFSGTVFYADADGRLQVQQVSWEKESSYRMPVALWQEMMNKHYPNSAWLYLDRDIFDRLYAFRRQSGHPSWNEAVQALLALAGQSGYHDIQLEGEKGEAPALL